MTGDRQSRRKVVGRRDGGHWERLYTLAVGAVAVGVIAVVGVLASAMVGGNSDGPAPGGTTVPGASPETATGTTGAGGPSPEVATPTPTTEPTEDEPAIVACGDMLAPMDKKHVLPEDCAPGDLRELPAEVSYGGMQRMRTEAAAAFISLTDAARRDGYNLFAVSAYRSYADQVAAYESNVQEFGKEYADRSSARPGRSEHQLGTTVDVSSESGGFGLEPFEGTPEATWIAEHAWEFGFAVSYPEGKEDITGYAYEPWHIRYVGKDIASEVQQSGLTLHEYLLR